MAQEPLKLKMKQMLGKTTKFATLNIRGIRSLESEKKLKHGCQKNKKTYFAYEKQETTNTVEKQ